MNIKLSVALVSLLLGGCATTYIPQAQSTALINVSELTDPKILVGKEWQTLVVGANGDTPISAGQRIVITSTRVMSGYNTTTTCYPTTSFLPQKDQHYYVNFIMKNDQCKLSILRNSSQNALGLAAEPSAVAYGDKLDTRYNIVLSLPN